MRMTMTLPAMLLGALAQSVPAADSVAFIAYGDAGFGSKAQYAVARAIGQVCAARGCEFAIGLGDNIYPNGAGSADDPQFEEKFEKPYADLHFPFFMSLGNHDNSDTKGGEGGNNERGDFQVAYARRHDRASDKWHMPARYYRFTAPLKGAVKNKKRAPLVEFFALDSSPLTPDDPNPDPQWNPETYGAKQFAWLDQGLRASQAKWRIAYAHHPYLSNGRHGVSKVYRNFLTHSVCGGGVDAFFGGHDHDLEWLKPLPECGRTQFFVSGAGASPRLLADPPPNAAYWQAGEKLGFWWIRLDGKKMTAAAFALGDDQALTLDAKGQPVAAFEQSVARVTAKR